MPVVAVAGTNAEVATDTTSDNAVMSTYSSQKNVAAMEQSC